jgi:radical SAM protein with 4Fe4S-binding SPASM domain
MAFKIITRLKKGFDLTRKGRFDLLLCETGQLVGIKHLVPVLPSLLFIEPTNICNLHCPTCATGSGRVHRPKSMMSFEAFQSIIDQVKGYVNRIELMLYGEPFMNKDFVRMTEYAVSAGIQVSTSTNGEFFTSKEFCEQVIKSGIHTLVICLDGADQETLSIFRKGSHFDTILNGIKWLVEAKRTFNLSTPLITLQFILMKHNEHQRELMRNTARELGVDVYREKLVGINQRDPNFQQLAKDLLPSDLSLSRYAQNEDGTFIHKGGPIPNYCTTVFTSTVIGADGSVIPCCYDPAFEYVMGNVFQETLKKIWKNKKYKAFRKQILTDRKKIPICHCSTERLPINDESDIPILD